MTQRSEVAQAWQTVAQTDEGRVILGDLARQYGFQARTLFDPNPQVMAFNEGTRSVMVYIGKLLSVDPQAVREMEQS